MHSYPKRLIEVDLPIKQISAHARREKSIRQGHISTLHIWWARRPLAACRAVICASLWPDPADPLCPPKFREEACRLINAFAAKAATDKTLAEHCSHDTWKKWQALAKSEGGLDFRREAHWNVLRFALLDFIADFANWDNSSVAEYLHTSRALTQVAHEALGGAPGTRPLVVDPFAGGGSIPLEALRTGADAFASDLNPIPVLLNKVVLEFIPKYGRRLADEVRKWGAWIKCEAEKELGEFYPNDADGATPIAYLWARTIQCEGPGCGAEVPLLRTLWLSKKPKRSVALQFATTSTAKRVDFRIIIKQANGWVTQDNHETKVEDPNFDGTMKRGSATCPCCGYTTPIARVKEQLKAVRGGVNQARLFCVVRTRPDQPGRSYRLPTERDLKANKDAATLLAQQIRDDEGPLTLVPQESTEGYHAFVNRGPLYGIITWADFYTSRQLLALSTLARLVREVDLGNDASFAQAVRTFLAMAVSRLSDRGCSLCTWRPQADQEKVEHVFSRQALPMTWDFAEGTFLSERTAGWNDAYEPLAAAIEEIAELGNAPGMVTQASATSHPLPDDSAQAIVTDPPYYYSVQYADLADFFYVWLRRMLIREYPGLFSTPLIQKDEEIIVQSPGHEFASSGKNNLFYETKMRAAMSEARRVLDPLGIGVVVFAHKSTSGWEAQLQSMVDAGWIITASWPIDTEMSTRLLAQNRAVLASSVHLVCRPREKRTTTPADEIGDWRDVLQELPRRIHDWMPRLAAEGVVGADAIFACLGPALEIFSRYERVEKASGDIVPLKEYLEQVWAAVAKEALAMIFTGADTSGFEEDARLTAMWLWTMNAGKTDTTNTDSVDEEESDDDSEGGVKKGKTTGFVLEYDAARKIAQGLGAHLEDLRSLVEVSGEQARLLPVGERARHLFGKDEGNVTTTNKKKKIPQLDLFKVLEEVDGEETVSGEAIIERHGKTVLDRIHQSMILFAAGRSEALKRFLVEEGVGRDQRFWSLAQALSALYPIQTSEKRWIDGVLARKKGLGF